MASTPSFSVQGKTAIITGAGSGINYCFAKLLLSHNCNVIIADLALRPEAQALITQFSARDTQTPRAIFIKTDVVNWKDLSNLFHVADQEFGGAEIICPGAGVFEPAWSNFWSPPGSPPSVDPFHGTHTESLGHYATLDINLTHPIRMTQLAISHWLHPPESASYSKASTKNPKRVIHIASIASQLSSLTTPLYIASKHAIAGFVRSLARLDEEFGIRVNAVAPGIIRTPLWTEHPEKLKMLDVDQDEWVEPEDVADAMLSCICEDEFPGGYIMEVLKGRRRAVNALNDPGPNQAAGGTVGNIHVTQNEALEAVQKPGWGRLVE